MKFDLTLRKLNNTNFASLYDRFIVGEELSPKEYECLLAIAICFTNATDVLVQQLGYRIIVEFCNQKIAIHPYMRFQLIKGFIRLVILLRGTVSPKNRETFSQNGTAPFLVNMLTRIFIRVNSSTNWLNFLPVRQQKLYLSLRRHPMENLN